jgi:hypothetical protein
MKEGGRNPNYTTTLCRNLAFGEGERRRRRRTRREEGGRKEEGKEP